MDERLIEKIEKLKQKRNAVILAHNYQPPEIQDLADFTGDSLGLSIKAAETDARVIVFCGVRFMAETAAVLSPLKIVLLPDELAGTTYYHPTAFGHEKLIRERLEWWAEKKKEKKKSTDGE